VRGDGFQALDAGCRERRAICRHIFGEKKFAVAENADQGTIEFMAEDFAEGFVAREFGGSDISARFAGSVQPPERGAYAEYFKVEFLWKVTCCAAKLKWSTCQNGNR
jgi:hypothetical protein